MERQGFDVIMNWSVKEFKAGLTEVGHTALRDRTEDNKADFDCRPQAPHSKASISEDSSRPQGAVFLTGASRSQAGLGNTEWTYRRQ